MILDELTRSGGLQGIHLELLNLKGNQKNSENDAPGDGSDPPPRFANPPALSSDSAGGFAGPQPWTTPQREGVLRP